MSLVKIQANKLPHKNAIFDWNIPKEKTDIFEKDCKRIFHDWRYVNTT